MLATVPFCQQDPTPDHCRASLCLQIVSVNIFEEVRHAIILEEAVLEEVQVDLPATHVGCFLNSPQRASLGLFL